VRLESIDPRLLSRPGLVLRALQLHQAVNPGDTHPTVGQLAAAGGIQTRTVIRGLAELVQLGLISIRPDPSNKVGRSIHLIGVMDMSACQLPELSGTPDKVVTPDKVGAPQLAPPPLNVSYVGRRSASAPDVQRGADNFGTPDKPVTPPDNPFSKPGNPILERLERLRLAIGPEHQEKLPLTGGDPTPRAKGTELRLCQVLGRLEVPECDETDLQWAIARLKGEYGPGFEGFYRKVCEQTRLGREPIGRLIAAVEEASREGVKNKGAAFIAACRRTMPTLAGTPDPGPNRQSSPGVRAENIVPAPDRGQFNQSVG
jgi:hypothetical protein